jgi:hypothetical protein
MSEDNIYNTFLTHAEIQMLTKGNYGRTIQAYMSRARVSEQEAKNIVDNCLTALESGETVISTGTNIKVCKQCRQPISHHKMDCSER